MRDRRDLHLRLSHAARHHRAAEREGARLEHRARGREVIGEGVEHAVAGAEAGGEKPARRAPPIRATPFGLIERTGRHEELRHLLGRRRVQPAERRLGLLQRCQIRFARHWQRSECLPVLYLPGIDSFEDACKARRIFLRMRDELGQRRQQRALARLWRASFQPVVVLKSQPPHSHRLRRR